MKYLQRTLEVEAEKWDGKNTQEVYSWAERVCTDPATRIGFTSPQGHDFLWVATPFGVASANIGDYIVCTKGSLSVMRAKDFDERFYAAT